MGVAGLMSQGMFGRSTDKIDSGAEKYPVVAGDFHSLEESRKIDVRPGELG